MTTPTTVLASVLGADNPVLTGLDASRAATLRGVQQCHDALFAPGTASATLAMAERRCLAYEVAESQGSAVMAAHYGTITGDGGAVFAPCRDASVSGRFEEMVEYVTRAGVQPDDVREQDVAALLADQMSPRDVVVISQIHAFVSYELRLVSGLQAISLNAGVPLPEVPYAEVDQDPVDLARLEPREHDFAEEDFGFTTAQLRWLPRLPIVDLDTITEEQRVALSLKSGRLDEGAYSRTLAHDPVTLANRAVLYDMVMYAKGGLDRVERELAALRVSLINGCRYCASVHGRRLAQLTKDDAWVQRLMTDWSAVELSPLHQAVDALCTALTLVPGTPPVEAVGALHDLGLDALELFDLVNVVAMFAWANRLMQTLGNHVLAAPADVSV